MKLGRCLQFRPGIISQSRAIRALVAPEEMADLLVVCDAGRLPLGYSFAHAVARWLAHHLASGALTYIPDPEGELDVWCSPWATRARGGGDCDDLAILVASFLLAGGIDAHVVVGSLVHGGSRVGHAWVEGVDRFGAFMIEATSGDLARTRPRTYVPFIRLGPSTLELAA